MEQTSNLGAFRRHAKPLIAGLALGLALVWAQNVMANPMHVAPQASDISSKVLRAQSGACASAIAAHERRHAIPRGLLKAISHAESGRWDQESGEIFAWPWTVTTGGKGYYLPNRMDAVAFVESLQADGVQNIDVGCMQINLKYHPDAFTSLAQAFDPVANAGYAATFLKDRFAQTRSWLAAAGQYHSTTPELNQKYKDKITKLWQGGANAAPATKTASAPNVANLRVAASTFARPDQGLTQRFNQAFQAKRSSGGVRTTAQGLAIANRYHALKPGASLTKSSDFAAKRQAQMLGWRRDNGYAQPLTQPVTMPATPAPLTVSR